VVTDNKGREVWRWDSTPFGIGKPDEDPDGDGYALTLNLRFPGQYYDIETGLHYNLLRYYDPSTGRYITSDQIGLRGGTNTYGYVSSNPLNWFDPFGLCKIDVRFAQLGPNWYHAYIVTTDTDGSRTYYRGGPSAGGPSSGASGAISSGSSGSLSGWSGSNSSGVSNSSNSSSPGSGRGGAGNNNGPWGPIVTEHGPYVPGTIDWETGTPPTMNIVDNNEPCGCNSDFSRIMQDIQNANIPYNPFSTNSNATVRETLERAGYHPGTPPVWAPGWGTQLP